MVLKNSRRQPQVTVSCIEQLRPNDGHLIAMMQLASPALPIGAFSYSQGLEAAVNAGLVSNETQAQEWIGAQFLQSFLPREIFSLKQAYECVQAILLGKKKVHHLAQIDEAFVASRDSAEGRLETRQLGSSLCRWLHSVTPEHPVLELLNQLREKQGGDLSSPVAFAGIALSQGLPESLTRFAWAFSWLENQVQAAVKLVPLGQSSGQRVLIALRPLSLREPPEEPWTCTPHASLLMMRHERQYSRLFRS